MNIFTKGLIKENPVLVLTLGMCASLATTTSVINGIGMGLSTTVVLICSNAVIAALRKIIPSKVRIASYIVVIAAFVTIVEMLINAFLPSLASSLGVFIPLIVVNCIILARAEAFASKNSIFASVLDGAGMGIGFTLALVLIASVREIIGVGTWCGFKIMSSGYQPATAFILPAGAFLTFGIILAVKNLIESGKEKKND
ncbi:MAG: electron transport complex subunit E [Clostridia bacterium]|nr:electron transport complex subunit E [Clostridia bacterium]